MASVDRWRLFVAVPIGDGLRETLAGAVDGWRDRHDLVGLRWSAPETWHLTILFLGATDHEAVPRLVRELEGVAARHAPIAVSTGGLGGFPSAARARVAWYGVEDPDRRLRRLADDVRGAFAPGEPARFRAHITLGRAKDEPIDLRPWIAAARPPAGTLSVAEVALMRSHLGRGPARYETVATLALGASVHA